MSEIVQVYTRSYCGAPTIGAGLCTFCIAPIQFGIDFVGSPNLEEVELSVMFLVNGNKTYQTIQVGARGLNLSPPEYTTYMEINLQKGISVDSYLTITITQQN